MNSAPSNHQHAKIGQYALLKNSEGAVLVLERARSKTWSLPGGRLNEGEEWSSALLREVFEETGLACFDPEPFAVNIITDPYQTKYCVYFKVGYEPDDEFKLSSEHSAARWVTSQEAEALHFEDPQIQDVVLGYLLEPVAS